MITVTQIRERVAGWVHDSVRADPVELLRHQSFMLVRLAICLMAALIIPPYMAIRGALSPWEAMIVLCAMAPMISVVTLSRTGNFSLAFAVSGLGYLCACAIFAYGAGGLSAPALVWLALAPFDALFSMSLGVVAIMSAAVLVAFVGIVCGIQTGLTPAESTLSPSFQLFIVAPAFAYAFLQTFMAVELNTFRARIERAAAARYQTLTSVMGDLVLRCDRSGAVLSASIECEGMFKLQMRDFVGRGLFERLMVQDRPVFLKSVSEAYAGDATVCCNVRLRTGSVQSRHGDFEEPVFTWVEMRARRIVDRNDLSGAPEQTRVMMVIRDITGEKRREQEIEAARAEAERANAWKDRFLANISHELRTPLNAIIGFSEILSNVDLIPAEAEKRREYAGIIHGSGQHLLEVVNSVLDISKMEAGRFAISPEPFEVRRLIDACCDIVSLRAEQAGVELKREIGEGIDELNADKRAFRQILINLLGNALKFTPREGCITVGARQEGDRVALFVSDTGCGMSPYDLPRLGGAFFQAGAPGERTYEGTGLGLSVVKGLVGLHGGEISVESGVGLGTCVTVRLPLECNPLVAGAASAGIIAIPRVAPIAGAAENSVSSWDIGRKSA